MALRISMLKKIRVYTVGLLFLSFLSPAHSEEGSFRVSVSGDEISAGEIIRDIVSDEFIVTLPSSKYEIVLDYISYEANNVLTCHASAGVSEIAEQPDGYLYRPSYVPSQKYTSNFVIIRNNFPYFSPYDKERCLKTVVRHSVQQLMSIPPEQVKASIYK